jgi:hypothetical protein
VAQLTAGIQPIHGTSRPGERRNGPAGRIVDPANQRGINNMPMFFLLPFIIATGMLSVAAESFSAGAKKSEQDR